MSEPTLTRLKDLPLFAGAVHVGEHAMRLAGPTTVPAPSTDPTHVPTTGQPWDEARHGDGRALDQDVTSRPHAIAAPEPAARASYHPARIDWALVRAYRLLAAKQLAELFKDRPGIDETDRRELGRSVIRRLLTDQAESDALTGAQPVSADTEATLAQALMDTIFGLGRLQPLIDDETVEDIEINGAHNVVLLHSDGRETQGAPVADTDEELIEFLGFVASRRTDLGISGNKGDRGSSGERPFSWANPRLRLALPNRARLTAMAWVTPHPVVRLRMHRHIDVTMADLLRMGMVSHVLANFLDAAVKARSSVVVAGAMGAGKTTSLRALARCVPKWESIGTLETEYELYLDQVGDWTRKPVTIESRPGSGEIGPTGRAAGELTLMDLFPDLLRLNLNRVIVGEVRGDEIAAMFEAMRSGAGSLSTIHAKNAKDTVDRIASLLHGTGRSMTYAYGQVAQHIDLIVHLDSRRDPLTGRRYRYVSEVIEVTPGDGKDTNLAVNEIFGPGPDGRAVPTGVPTFIDDLVDQGFDRSQLDQVLGAWQVGMQDLR